MPLLLTRASRNNKSITEYALVDSGAGLNVLPHRLGVELGLDWDELNRGPNLSGNADGETKLVELLVKISDFDELPLLFAWSVHDRIRFILGQDDFFRYFHVCFFGDRNVFSVSKIEPA
jgi:hypothetical protein